MRKGTSTVEVIICTIILSVAALSVGKFSGRMHQSLREREMSVLVNWELQNVRAQIESWPAGEISKSKIEGLPVSGNLQSELTNARWQAEVVAVDEPIAAWRIHVELTGQRGGQAVVPAELVCWVPQEEDS